MIQNFRKARFKDLQSRNFYKTTSWRAVYNKNISWHCYGTTTTRNSKLGNNTQNYNKNLKQNLVSFECIFTFVIKSRGWLIMKSPKTIWSSRVVSVWYQIWSFMNSQIILEPFVRPTVLAFMELTVFNFKLDWSISMIYNLVGEMNFYKN